jgi:HPt (histidine-containing phosphotransfer) domain-containing protein
MWDNGGFFMTVKEFYDSIGGGYEEIIGRMGNDERVEKFLGKLLKDPSYQLLCDMIKEKNMPEAFRAAHTLKGVCKNLTLTRLGNSADEMTELLRNRENYGEDIEPVLARVTEDYRQTAEGIRKLLDRTD